jgi:prevent-host-death family protein
MKTKSISSTLAQNNFGRILDEVVLHGTRYIVHRRNTPQVIILSLADFEFLLSDEAEQTKLGAIVREISPSYDLGESVE